MKRYIPLIAISIIISNCLEAEEMDSIRIARFQGTKKSEEYQYDSVKEENDAALQERAEEDARIKRDKNKERAADKKARAAHEQTVKDGGDTWKDSFIYLVNTGIGLDDFRGIPDGSWAGNFGAIGAIDGYAGFELDLCYFGLQIGGQYGVYDWNGRGNTSATNQTVVQQQGIITAAAFIGGPKEYGLVAAFAYDVMLNAKYGLFAIDPLVDQMRLKIGYTIFDSFQFGGWGSYYVQTDHLNVDNVDLSFRAINQISAYASYFFKNDSHLTLWGGRPYGSSLMFDKGSPGRWLIGGEFVAVLNKYFSMTGYGSYMAPHVGTVLQNTSNYGSDIGALITFSLGQRGNRAAITMGNNSNFWVDTNINE